MKDNKLYMTLFFSLILLGSMKTGISQAQTGFEKSVFNFGAKVGLNALTSTNYDVYYNDTKMDFGEQENKYGYLVNLFARINLDRFFMQPELEWNHYRQECSFALPSASEEKAYQPKQTLEVNENAAIICVLAGYHIVRAEPYIINCYIGGSTRINYKTEYKFEDSLSFLDRNNRYNYTAIIGSSLNVGIIHFDIRYHFNFPNTNFNLSEMDNLPENYGNVSFQKNENILSFSCGIMF